MKFGNDIQTVNLISQRDVILLSEIPDNILDAWIEGITTKSDYLYERDFIVNIFNEIYEGHQESHDISVDDMERDRELYRAQFEQLLRAEKQQRLCGEHNLGDVDIFDLDKYK